MQPDLLLRAYYQLYLRLSISSDFAILSTIINIYITECKYMHATIALLWEATFSSLIIPGSASTLVKLSSEWNTIQEIN